MAPKAKKEKMSLGTFLTNEDYGSWADEMEDMPITYTDSRAFRSNDRSGFGSAPSGMGGSSFSDRPQYATREQLPLPTEPPFTAHIGNMSFDTASADLSEFFKDCAVTNVRIVEDKLDHKPKGFAYVEFGTLDGLKTALTYSGTNLGGRNIRISVAEPPKEKESSRDFSDWSRKGPLPDLPQQQRRVSDRGGFGNRFDSGASDNGMERSSSRRGFEQGDGKSRDFGNWERKGPLSPITPVAGSLRDGGRQKSRDGPGFRRTSPSWGEGRSQDGSRPPRREQPERPPREPTAAERDNQWRSNMRPDPPAAKSPPPTQSRETSTPSSPAQPPAPATRPRLNLQKRTVSEAVKSPGPEGGDSKSSPFGAARPIDTSAREKEIEEKRQLAYRQKKEAEDKARAEKAEEKKATKDSKEKVTTEKPANKAASASGSKEDDDEKPAPKPNFALLRRVTGDGANGMAADEDEEAEGEEEEASAENKDTKPSAPVSKTNGSWRSGPGPEAKSDDKAAPVEDEGWSTIPTKQRNNRRGNQGQRAIAS